MAWQHGDGRTLSLSLTVVLLFFGITFSRLWLFMSKHDNKQTNKYKKKVWFYDLQTIRKSSDLTVEPCKIPHDNRLMTPCE